MPRAYQRSGVRLCAGAQSSRDDVLALQSDLRELGYLKGGIDGQFGRSTDAAVRALQHDLIHNDGLGSDGQAPIAVKSFNANAQRAPLVADVNGVVDENLATCIDAMFLDQRFVRVPSSNDPAAENQQALAAIWTCSSRAAPTPFVAAIARQESGGRQFNVPSDTSRDSYIVVGLDRNASDNDIAITSRGYGIGQYTLFHHPPQPAEADLIRDPVRNVAQIYEQLAFKFNNFVAGPKDTADDRSAEQRGQALRVCRHAQDDPRYLRDCVNCARSAGTVTIRAGTPVYLKSSITYAPTQYYPSAVYDGVPDRSQFGCDWPYAARRYNGAGLNSYHYQTRVLLNVARGPS